VMSLPWGCAVTTTAKGRGIISPLKVVDSSKLTVEAIGETPHSKGVL
jgi:hypothetical protein